MQPEPVSGVEEPLSVIFCDGQRCEVSVRSEAGDDGVWHNALVFRRAGRVLGEPWLTGVDWHLPPGIVLTRARELSETDLTELFRRALRPRAPLV